jgi:hypothetical protein
MTCPCRNRRKVFETSALEGVRGQHHAPATLTPGKSQTEDYLDLGVDLNRHGKLSPPGFHPRNVQSVASRYTDYGIQGAN